MIKKIEILSVKCGVEVIAKLLEKKAPETCNAMWKCLEKPMETEGIQAMWVGPELMFIMPEENQRVNPREIPLENATSYPLPGDVLFKYYPPYVERHPYNIIAQDKPIWDFFLIYGPDPILGSTSATVWAHIDKGLEDLANVCKKIREEGLKMFQARRLK